MSDEQGQPLPHQPMEVTEIVGVKVGFAPLQGDTFWLARSSYVPDQRTFRRGAPLPYNEPQNLFAAICEYFQHVQDNPLYKTKIAYVRQIPQLFALAANRPMTLQGLLTFIGARSSHWVKWKDDTHLGAVVEWAEQVIYQNKFEGALVGEFNPTMIIRDLGLADKQEVGGMGGGGGEPIVFQVMPIAHGTFVPEEPKQEAQETSEP